MGSPQDQHRYEFAMGSMSLWVCHGIYSIMGLPWDLHHYGSAMGFKHCYGSAMGFKHRYGFAHQHSHHSTIPLAWQELFAQCSLQK